MSRFSYLIVVTLVACVAFGCSLFNPPSVEANMLINGGFENDLTGWKLNWSGEGKSVDIDTDYVVEGKKSLRLSNEAGVETSIGVRQDIDVVAGQQYRVRAAARSGELVHEGTRQRAILLRLQYVDENDQNLQQHREIFVDDTDGEWVFYSRNHYRTR